MLEVLEHQRLGGLASWRATASMICEAAGLPGLALPCEPAPDGMPIGGQLVAGVGRDAALLALGATLQDDWRWPDA